jgi:uncharacterized protein (TIGR02600 family)
MPDPLAKPNRPKPNPLEGAALIIVLSCLVLLAALAIGLLNRVETDRSNASAYRGSTLTRNLAEYAINVVMTQISAATKSDPTLAWASQPGAIRTYSATGTNLVNFYKLYSSPEMVTNAFPRSDTNLSTWAINSALFTDLNAPVVTGTGVSARTNYPILDPRATNSVQGFDITDDAPTNATQLAPMPVNWLYVLEDGTLVAPISATADNAVTITGASTANPIVGRIAFWTDDDTSKININTASGAPWNYTNTTVTTDWGAERTVPAPANYWDTPVAGGRQEINLAISQPWGGEYQRFPGHPATVSLSAAFKNLATNDIMDIAPNITYQNAGSNVGSFWGNFVTPNSAPLAPGSATRLVDPVDNDAAKIPQDGARLYANVDELLFSTNRSATGTNRITPQDIEYARFFVTASSRAPDVTLFNTPRIQMWPITSIDGSTNKVTPFDRLIAFCGTLGPNTNYGSSNAYYFTRWNPLSATVDYTIERNQKLMEYLKRMTQNPVPGFGGSEGILGKYQEPFESDQIRTQIFDYIRCINTVDMSTVRVGTETTNQYIYATNSAVMPTQGTNNTRGFGRFPTITKVGMHFWFNSYFTNGGVTNTNVSLCARLMMEPFYASHGHPSPVSSINHRITVSGMSSLRWGTSSANATSIFTSDSNSFQVSGSGRPHGGRVSAESTANTTGFIATSPTNSSATLFSTNSTDTFYFSGGDLKFTITDASGSTTHQVIDVNLPEIPSLPVPLDTTTVWRKSVYFSGNKSTYGTYNLSANRTIGDGTISANGTMTVNNTVTHGIGTFNGPTSWTNGFWTNALDTSVVITNVNRLQTGQNVRFRPEDVVRAVGVVHGDFRLIAANPQVGTNSFDKIDGGVGAYTSSDPNQRLAHNFVGEYPYSMMGARFPKQSYYNTNNTNFFEGRMNSLLGEFGPLLNTSNNPVINWNSNGLYVHFNGDPVRHTNTSVNGDFDNGYGAAGDGPYIGFSDEGNTRVYRFIYTGETNIVYSIPYLDGSGALVQSSGGVFSPHRIVSSPGIMGSLPTGVKSQTPWQTLLFRPALLTSVDHPGRGIGNQGLKRTNEVADCLLLDLFNMSVVEPYAISEPLSTAGRVNMNYQILPFTYIKRSTAVQAALHAERIIALPDVNNTNVNIIMNTGRKTASFTNYDTRLAINLNTNTGTLRGFEDRFGSNDIFRSAAEICSIPLVPLNFTWTSVTNGSFWSNYTLTGDNSKERPYSRIYPKLTTKSNTYTVHYRVEVLKKSPNNSKPETWSDATDKVISTYRGSTTIERYVNPRDPGLPDYASITTLPPKGTNALPNFYKFRILGERQFNP